MTLHDTSHPSVSAGDAIEARPQYGALCFRLVGGKTKILLITSRTRRRWIIPKGWPIEGKSPAQAAAVEAWEEAGVRGKVQEGGIGSFGYLKLGDGKTPDQPCAVTVFPLKVKSLAKTFPERHQRRRKWFSLKAAAMKVEEPELRRIIKAFDGRKPG